jgi:hypothetical protein
MYIHIHILHVKAIGTSDRFILFIYSTNGFRFHVLLYTLNCHINVSQAVRPIKMDPVQQRRRRKRACLPCKVSPVATKSVLKTIKILHFAYRV